MSDPTRVGHNWVKTLDQPNHYLYYCTKCKSQAISYEGRPPRDMKRINPISGMSCEDIQVENIMGS